MISLGIAISTASVLVLFVLVLCLEFGKGRKIT